jgi:hypothetical protein
VARVRIALEAVQIRHDLGPDRIQLNIADAFAGIGRRRRPDGLVPVLQARPPPPVAPLNRPGIAREEASHAAGERDRPGPNQAVAVVGSQRPGGDGETLRDGAVAHAPDDLVPIGILPDDGAPFDPPHHHRVPGLRRVEPWPAWHGEKDLSSRDERHTGRYYHPQSAHRAQAVDLTRRSPDRPAEAVAVLALQHGR